MAPDSREQSSLDGVYGTDLYKDRSGVLGVARERLPFPWSKPANVTIGSKLRFAVEKHTLDILEQESQSRVVPLIDRGNSYSRDCESNTLAASFRNYKNASFD